MASHALNTGDPQRYAFALIAGAEASRRVGDIAAASRALHSIPVSLRAARFPTVIAWQHWSKANVARMRGDYVGSSRLLDRAVQLALAGKDRTVLKYALAGLAEDQRILGRYRIAMLRHKEAYQLFRDDGDARGVVWALEGIAQIGRMRGFYSAARTGFKAAAVIARQAEDKRGLGYALKGLGECEVLSGNPNGLQLIEEACRHFTELNFTIGLSFATKTMADANCHLGNVSEAMAGYVEARLGFEKAGDARGLAFARLGVAVAYAKLKKHDQALSEAKAAAEEFKRLKVRAGIILTERVRKRLAVSARIRSGLAAKSTICSSATDP